MSASERRQSLFWSVAGVLLAASVLATAAQIAIAFGILRPIEVRETRARAGLIASALARDVENAASAFGTEALDSLIVHRRLGFGQRAPWLLLRLADGTLHGAPASRVAWVRPLLSPYGAPLRIADPAPREGAPRHLELLAHEPLHYEGRPIGEVIVLQPERADDLFGMLRSPATLVQLPVAFLLAAAVGLFFVTVLGRRLQAIRALATRVAEGDLSVRIGDTSGDEIGELASSLDQMTMRLQEARDHIAAADFQRRQLFADITHELATPLTSIRANAETLLDPGVALDEHERQRYVKGVLAESQRLDRLIRDLFDLARLEAGASPLVRERLDWASLIRHTVDRFAPRFEQAGIALAHTSACREAWIDADGHRMEQVLDNLLGNALHYVPRGGRVEVSLAAHPRGFQLEVADDGPGVPADELPRLFERFYRASDQRGGGAGVTAGGTGLGLAIVREIVLRHGGVPAAHARAPRGLSLTVQLPVAPAA